MTTQHERRLTASLPSLIASMLCTVLIGGCVTFDEVSEPVEPERNQRFQNYLEGETGRQHYERTHQRLESRLAGVDAAAGERLHQELMASNGLATDQQLATLFPHDEVPFKSHLIRTSTNELSVTLESSVSPQYLFAPGVYRIDQTDLIGKAMVAWVASVVNEIDTVLGDTGYQSDTPLVEATFVGSADGVPISSAGVVYAGEFGRVVMPYENTTLNGQAHRFEIWTGQAVSNDELAALRAASLAAMVNVLVVPRSWSVAYEIETAAERGQGYRYAQVKLRLREGAGFIRPVSHSV